MVHFRFKVNIQQKQIEYKSDSQKTKEAANKADNVFDRFHSYKERPSKYISIKNDRSATYLQFGEIVFAIMDENRRVSCIRRYKDSALRQDLD